MDLLLGTFCFCIPVNYGMRPNVVWHSRSRKRACRCNNSASYPGACDAPTCHRDDPIRMASGAARARLMVANHLPGVNLNCAGLRLVAWRYLQARSSHSFNGSVHLSISFLPFFESFGQSIWVVCCGGLVRKKFRLADGSWRAAASCHPRRPRRVLNDPRGAMFLVDLTMSAPTLIARAYS